MYAHVEFEAGNPWISTADKNLLSILRKYELVHCEGSDYIAMWRAYERPRKLAGYQEVKAAVRDFAIEYQWACSECAMSYFDCADWQSFFEYAGKRYGLLSEFRENAIC